MIEKLNNFSYDSVVSINAYGLNTNIDMNCKEDRTNKLGYCYVTSNVVNIEEYLDYNNKVTYSKSDLISNSDNQNEWKKSEEKDIMEVPMLKMVDGIKIQKKEKMENGTLYIGIINGKSISQIIKTAGKAAKGKISFSRLFNKKIPVEVFVNNDNYIEYLNSDVSVLGIKINIKVKYHDYNTSGSLSLPREVYGL